MRLPEPRPHVKQALALLPHQPGVYILRDERGRVIYVGRSRDLATRARSYWTDLRDRPHLKRMLPRVEWLEPVLCASEHEAAFLESDLLRRHRTWYNRTLGMESRVWLRLDTQPQAPGLSVMHEADPRDGATWFGPYLGWEPVRQAATGLLRLFPLDYAGTAIGRTERELARSLGVTADDAGHLATSIASVLRREPSAVRSAMQGLEAMRDRGAERLMFEWAAEVQEYIRGLIWITQPQKLSALDPVDGDFGATSGSVRVVISMRSGRMAQRHVYPSGGGPRRTGSGGDVEWHELARDNARLMSSLTAAGAVGPLGWKPLR